MHMVHVDILYLFYKESRYEQSFFSAAHEERL